MILKTSKTIEEQIEVKTPFAAKDLCFYYLVTDEFVVKAGEGCLFRSMRTDAYFDKSVMDALTAYRGEEYKSSAIDVQEAEQKISEVVESFQLQTA